MSIVPAQFERRVGNPRDTVMEDAYANSVHSTESQSVSIDFVGAMLRRKWVIFLLVALSVIIAILAYILQAPQFASNLRIMIWTQAPPSIVNGETVLQSVSLPKHQNLIKSELVLSDALDKGALAKLSTFEAASSPLLKLRKSLDVVPIEKSADTLEITCKGPHAGELPKILHEVVESYIRVINEETAATGKESVAIIEKLQNRVVEEKDVAEKRYFELMKKLGLSSETVNGELVNPFLDKVKNLTEQRDLRQREEREASDRIRSLEEVENFEGENRPDLVKAIVLEAEKYLQLGETPLTNNQQVANADLQRRLQDQLTNLEMANAELEKKAALYAQSFDENHPSRKRVNHDLEFNKSRKADLQAEIAKLKSETAKWNSSLQEGETKEMKTANDAIIRLYHTALRRDRDRHFKEVRDLNEELDALSQQMASVTADMSELNLLRIQIKEKENSLREILDRLSKISLVSSNYATTKVKVIDNPLPGVKVAPSLRNFLLFAILIGSSLGGALAIVLDRSDLSYRNPLEIFNKLGVPVISKIPLINSDHQENEFSCALTLATAINRRSPAAEAFRAARTAMLYYSRQTGAKVFLMTSPSPGDGKSTTITNLAISIAQSGKRVVILDADLHRPRIHSQFGIEAGYGLVDYGHGKLSLDDITQSTAIHENLFVVTAGSQADSPGEFVVSSAFKDVLNGLKERFDIVLVDSPPLLPVADATAISTQVDAVLLVFRIRDGIVLASQKARDLLELVHAKILGVIVNGVDENPFYDEFGAYGYSRFGYSSRYAAESKKYYAEEFEAS